MNGASRDIVFTADARVFVLLHILALTFTLGSKQEKVTQELNCFSRYVPADFFSFRKHFVYMCENAKLWILQSGFCETIHTHDRFEIHTGGRVQTSYKPSANGHKQRNLH